MNIAFSICNALGFAIGDRCDDDRCVRCSMSIVDDLSFEFEFCPVMLGLDVQK